MPRSSLKVLPVQLYFRGKRPLHSACAMAAAFGLQEKSKAQLVFVQHSPSSTSSWLMAAVDNSFVSGIRPVFLCMAGRVPACGGGVDEPSCQDR